MYHIIQALKESPFFLMVDILELIDEESIQLIKIRAEAKDHSLLYITELHTTSYQKYSYHWQKANGELLIRWDNKTHGRPLDTFSDHRHEHNKIYPSYRVSIDDVINTMKKKMG